MRPSGCPTILGRSLREKRMELNMSQRDAAEALSVTFGYISQIETGNVAPSLSMLVKLADFIGMNDREIVRALRDLVENR